MDKKKIIKLNEEIERMMNLHYFNIRNTGKDNSESDFDKGAVVAYGFCQSKISELFSEGDTKDE